MSFNSSWGVESTSTRLCDSWWSRKRSILSCLKKHVNQLAALKRRSKNYRRSENWMKQGLKGRLAIDTSALIELIYCEAPGQNLKKALESDVVEAWTSEIAIAELRYVLCRSLGWSESNERVNKRLDTGYLKVEDTLTVINEASKKKC